MFRATPQVQEGGITAQPLKFGLEGRNYTLDTHKRGGDVIRALLSGYAAPARANKLMVMLQAFVDDSASEAGDKRLFLAGYINGADQWAAFSDAWLRQLRTPPAIDYFKMSEAQYLSGQFQGWLASDRDKKVLNLAQVVSDSRPWSIHCSVSREEYKEIVAPVAPYGLQSPYFACFWGVIHAAADYHRQLATAGNVSVPPVDFIFDEQVGQGDEAAAWYRWAKDQQDPAIRELLGATPIFRDDKLVLPLQAADMLAWHLRRDHEHGELEDRTVFNLLVDQGAYHFIEGDILRGLASKMRRVPGVRSIQTKSSWREHKKLLGAYAAAGLQPPEMSYARLLFLDWRLRFKDWWNRFRYPR